MSLHIDASFEEISENILLPGDPIRAKFIADNYLTDAKCVNQTRGMLAYSGHYNNHPISVMGSGMGQASLAIYVNELIDFYKVKKIIRVGTCGSYQDKVKVRDIVLAQSSSTDAAHNKLTFNGMDYSACSDFQLLLNAYQIGSHLDKNLHVGNVLASDSFYPYNSDESWTKWAKFGVLAVEMETNALYTICAKNNVQALSILTVSDSLVTKESTTSKEREITFKNMVEIALQSIILP